MTATRTMTINCTSCGAGLDVLGGGRVRRHFCPYCGAELDAQDNYAVLRKYRDLKRPETPLSLGMSGRIDGVDVTVIGTIGMEEKYGGETWTWVNHQVYSPTHGYAWLTWEENRLVFTRKTRSHPRPSNYTARQINNAEQRPSFRHEEGKFRYYGSGQVRMTFVEGEFNFAPRIGKKTRYVSALGRSKMLTVRKGTGGSSGGELEYELSSMPEQRALIESFGIDRSTLPRARGVHPLETFQRSALAAFTRNCAGVSAVLSLIMMVITASPGDLVHRAGDRPVTAPATGSFSVSLPDQLVEITLNANLDNSWVFFEGEITDDEDEVVATFTQELGFYHGWDDGNWTEGSRSGSVLLKLPAGRYDYEVAMEESGVWRSGRPPTLMGITISEGVAAGWWMVIATIFFAGLTALFLIQRAFHNSRRWSGSDWTDEDD
ncbi:MAG: hypothetical protein AAF577_02200 [Pseudomonadota bacterium]